MEIVEIDEKTWQLQLQGCNSPKFLLPMFFPVQYIIIYDHKVK